MMKRCALTLVNTLLSAFGRKVVLVGVLNFHTGKLGRPWRLHVGATHWPDQMGNLEFFMRRKGLK